MRQGGSALSVHHLQPGGEQTPGPLSFTKWLAAQGKLGGGLKPLLWWESVGFPGCKRGRQRQPEDHLKMLLGMKLPPPCGFEEVSVTHLFPCYGRLAGGDVGGMLM